MILSQIDGIAPKDIPGILAYFNDDIEAAILDTYVIAGLEFGRDLITEERAEGAEEDPLREAIQEETDILKELTDLNDSTSEAVGDVMQKGVKEGWTTAQLQQAIIDLGAFTPARALRIARTITGAGASQGQWLSAKMVNASHKIWATAGDSHVRDLHQRLNGEKVGIDEKFSNGARYPLDPKLSAAQRVNCRCSLMFVIDETVDEFDFGASRPPENPMMTAADTISCCDKPLISDWEEERSLGLTSEEWRAAKLKRDSCKGYRRTLGGRWVDLNGKNVSPEISKQLDEMNIPPGWKNVAVSSDPLSEIIAVGQDEKGRWKYLYSEEYTDKQKWKKFDRVKLFADDMDSIRDNIEEGILEGDPKAYLLKLEDMTGIRVGSLTDTKADVQAYGLTTLQSNHVKVEGDKIILDFIAKEGIPAHYEITDPILARFFEDRLAAAAVDSPLFPDVTEKTINKYLKEVSDGKKYTMKDYRTYNATRIAHEELQKYSGKVYTEAERKKIIMEVSTIVSEFLHNGPTMARDNYIDPRVWDIIGGFI